MTAAMAHDTTSPYLLDEPPTSPGKVLLSRAFAHWCVLHYGFSPEEIVAALGDDANVDRSERTRVRAAARLIGELIAAGEIRAFARPFGGGSPEQLKAGSWELDSFHRRFAQSAINPEAPFENHVDPTHWIFLELEDFNRIVEVSCADVMPSPRSKPVGQEVPSAAAREQTSVLAEDRHVRMPEIERRTGMSRSTIYRRVEQERFPAPIPMDGNIAAWRESDVAEWLSNPR